MVVFSNHGVFDGQKAAPYVESDEAARVWPLEARALGEKRALIIRTSTLIDQLDDGGVIARMATSLVRGEPVEAASDVLFAPSAASDVSRVALDLLIDEAWGVWHLINGSPLTWRALAEQLASTLNADHSLIYPAAGAKQGITLSSEQGWLMPSLTPLIERFAEAAMTLQQRWSSRAS